MALYEPVVGALLLALERAATMDDRFHGTLGETLAAAESRYGVRFRAE
jgi:hypothetical protein